jgi:hypothetical protein
MIENLFTFVRTLGNQRIQGKKFFVTQVGLLGTVSDNSGSIGTAGKVLSSTGSGVSWITVGSGSSNVAVLNDLTDVVISTAAAGNLLRFNGTSWVNWAPNFVTGYGSLNDLSDVTLTTPVNGARLVYSSTASQWIDAAPLDFGKMYYGTGTSGDGATTTVITNGTKLSIGTGAFSTNLNIGQVDITTGIAGQGSIHIGATQNGSTYLLASNNKIQVGSQTEELGYGLPGDPNNVLTFTPSTLNIQPLGGDTVFGAYTTATGYKTPSGSRSELLTSAGTKTLTDDPDNGQILRWIQPVGGVGNWYADDESSASTPSLDAVTGVGSTTTNSITVGNLSTSGKVTTPLIEREGVLTINSEQEVEQGEPNPNLLYVSWTGDNKFVINADGYAIADTGYKVVGGTASGFLKANGTIDTSTYLTENQTLDAVTDLGSTTTNSITVGSLTVSAGGIVTAPVVYSPVLWTVSEAIRIMADENSSLQPSNQGEPANPVIYFEWAENTLGFIDTDAKITFQGFKTPTGTASGFLKANGTVDTSVYLTSMGNLDDIGDVELDSAQAGEALIFNGEEWINEAIPVPTLDSVTDAGNTTTNTIDVGGVKSDYLTLDTEATPTPVTGMFSWNTADDTANLQLASGASLQLGQEQHWHVKNSTGVTIPDGTVVMSVGTNGNSGHILAGPMIADGTVEERYVLGIATGDILNGGFGHVTSFGKVRGLDTSAFVEGAVLYCDPVVPGGLTAEQPEAPNLDIPIAFVVSSHHTNGILAVRVLPGYHLGELHDVHIDTASTGQLLRYIKFSNRWENWTPDYLTSFTETDPVFTASPAYGIGESNITKWDTAHSWGNHADYGYLTSLPTHTHAISDVTGLQTALDGKVPTTRTLTINGTAFDLSDDRSWTISSADGYISDVTLSESGLLKFEGQGSAFTGDIDLSGLPFQPVGTYLTAEADTLQSVTTRGSSTTTGATFGGDVGIGTTGPTNKLHVASSTTFGTVARILKLDQSVSGGDTTQPTYYGSILLSGGGHDWGAIDTIQTNPSVSWTSRMAFSTMPGGGDYNLYERMCINNAGNVGIGTTSPTNKLDIAGSLTVGTSKTGNTDIEIKNSSNSKTHYVFSDGTTGELGIESGASVGIKFNTSGANTRMVIASTGNVGIGTTTPATKLDVSGVITATDGNSTNWNTAYGWGNHADYGYWNTDSVDAKTVKSAEVVFVGNVTVEGTFTESSSIRFKENITPLDPALDKVNQLEAVSYNKIGVDDREIGLIAEDVAELFPEVVTYNEDGQPQGIQYQRLSVILLKAVQELTERVNRLENK